MAHQNNIFKLGNPEYILLDHLVREVDIANQIISIVPYYQHGAAVGGIWGGADPQFIYIGQEFSVFTSDDTLQMSYNVFDENGGGFSVLAAQTVIFGGVELFETRMKQMNFICQHLVNVLNIDYAEFVGWQLTLKI